MKIAFAGAGGRGEVYADSVERLDSTVELVAVGEPDEVKRVLFSERHHIPSSMCFSSAEELLAQPKLADILVIATPDRQHAAQAIATMEKGYDLLLEKPIAENLEDCKRVAEAADRYHRKVVVCHVLRYTPFYGKIKELIDSGVIGKVMSIEATEKVCWWHQAHSFVRGNWRNSNETSPMILQKSCHDMDIFLWLTGKHCERVSSFGHLSHFKAECAPEGAPERCTESCPIYETCPYSVNECYLKRARNGNFGWPVDIVSPIHTMEALQEKLKNGPYGRCVYHCDNNVVDHQVVNLQMEDDVTVSFTMCAFTSQLDRRIHVMGTKGDIIGNMETGQLRLAVFGKEPQTVKAEMGELDHLGHGGGDILLVRDILDTSDHPSRSDVHLSVESHTMALAAEKSRLNGGIPVEMKEFFKNPD